MRRSIVSAVRPSVVRYKGGQPKGLSSDFLENDILDRKCFLQSRSDPTEEFYKFTSDGKLEIDNEIIYRTFPIPNDHDAEMAWRHATYNPPKASERKN